MKIQRILQAEYKLAQGSTSRSRLPESRGHVQKSVLCWLGEDGDTEIAVSEWQDHLEGLQMMAPDYG